MDGKKKKRRGGLHIGVLALGAYMLVLGGGTLLVNLTELRMGERNGIVVARALLGAALTCAGVYAVWDAVRDLFASRREEPRPTQFIFTGAAGVRSSNVTAETLREQISLISEDMWHVSLQPLTPLAGHKDLVKLDYALMDEGMFLVAVSRSEDGGLQICRKPAEAGEAEAVMAALLEGRAPDVSGWESLEAAPRRPQFRLQKRLTLIRDSGRNDHEFFTERDLDLAVTGLEDGTYQEVTVQIGSASINAVSRADGNMMLHLQFQSQDGPRAFWRIGMPNQARFWLLQFCDGSLFQPFSEDWNRADS